MTRSNLTWLSCGIAIGAALALGIIMAGGEPVRDTAAPRSETYRQSSEAPTGRDIYSPNVSNDPYVIDQQRKVIEALELQCRHFGEQCDEARKARRWLEADQRR